MHPTRRRALAAVTLAGIVSLAPLVGARAHEGVEVGDLEIIVGFVNEPAYTGQPNGVQLRLLHGGDPVNDAAGDLEVVVSYGDDETDPSPLVPAFLIEGGKVVSGTPGEYRYDFIPSQPGKYSFHITGTVGDEEIDETFTAGPETFSIVQDPAEAEFPALDAPSISDISTRLERESGRIADAAASIEAAEAAAAAASDAAAQARTIATIAVIVGAIGVIAGIAALATRNRA